MREKHAKSLSVISDSRIRQTFHVFWFYSCAPDYASFTLRSLLGIRPIWDWLCLPVSALGLLQFDDCLFCFCIISSISMPFRRLCQADHIAEGKTRPQCQELHALLFSTSVWDF